MSTLKSFLALGNGEPPAPPKIFRKSHRCEHCRERAYKDLPTAEQACQTIPDAQPELCDLDWCGHYRLAKAEPPPKKKRWRPSDAAICSQSGKPRYSSSSAAEAAADQLNEWNGASARKGRMPRFRLRAYRCSHCQDWHLTKRE